MISAISLKLSAAMFRGSRWFDTVACPAIIKGLSRSVGLSLVQLLDRYLIR